LDADRRRDLLFRHARSSKFLINLQRRFTSVGVIAQIQEYKPSATAEKNYTRRPIDMLHMHHAELGAWILEICRVA